MQCPEVMMRMFGRFQTANETETKRDALAWLAGQLRWEHTLDELRSGDEAEREAQAA